MRCRSRVVCSPPTDQFEVTNRDDVEKTHVVATRHGGQLRLEPVPPTEVDQLFSIFDQVVRDGEGYPQLPPLTRESFEAMWVLPVSIVVGAFDAAVLLGAYYLRPNGVGRAAHVANAGYVVEKSARSSGVGRCLIEDSIERARLLGFDAMQFNFVFASNPARQLYEELGFRLIGAIPDGVAKDEDALIYWRAL